MERKRGIYGEKRSEFEGISVCTVELERVLRVTHTLRDSIDMVLSQNFNNFNFFK